MCRLIIASKHDRVRPAKRKRSTGVYMCLYGVYSLQPVVCSRVVQQVVNCKHHLWIKRVTFIHPLVQPAIWTQRVVQPVGWPMLMSPAERRLSGPARTFMTSLGWRAQQGGCVDSRRCGAFDWNLNKKSYVCTYLVFTLGSIWSWAITKITSLTKLYTFYLFNYYVNIQNVS